jgi:hypothetical protein
MRNLFTFESSATICQSKGSNCPEKLSRLQHDEVKVKVKQSLCRSIQGLRVPRGGALRFQGIRLMQGVRLSVLRTSRLNPPENITGTHFCWNAVGRIMSKKNSNDIIGNRTRDLPACSTVPQTNAHPRASVARGGNVKSRENNIYYGFIIIIMFWLRLLSLATGLFFLVLPLDQRRSPPLKLQVSDCSTFRIMCDVPSITVSCSESIECFLGMASRFIIIIIIIVIIIRD